MTASVKALVAESRNALLRVARVAAGLEKMGLPIIRLSVDGLMVQLSPHDGGLDYVTGLPGAKAERNETSYGTFVHHIGHVDNVQIRVVVLEDSHVAG